MNQLEKIDAVIREHHPEYSEVDVASVREKIIDYICSGLSEGFDIALIKRVDDATIVRVLRIVES